MRAIKKFLCILFCLLYLTACQLDSRSSLAKKSLFTSVDVEPLVIANNTNNDEARLTEVKQTVTNFSEIYDVAVIGHEKKVLVVYKVKQRNRFQMQKIETKVSKELQHNFPGFNFVVSSDLKIFLEAVELIVQARKNNYPPTKAKKWFASILKLQKDAI